MTTNRRTYRGGADEGAPADAPTSFIWRIVGLSWVDQIVWALMLAHVVWSVVMFGFGNAYYKKQLRTQNKSSTTSVLTVQASRNQARLFMLRMFLSLGIWLSFSVIRFFFEGDEAQCGRWIFLLYGAIYGMQLLALAMLIKPWDKQNVAMRGTTFGIDGLLIGTMAVFAIRDKIPFLSTAPASAEK